jgi:protein-S-isoprenylcysteine O-methyltransferase Ste14
MNNNFSQYLIAALGLFTLARGIMILFTGKLGEREMARLRGFSENGIKKYKMLSAIMNIVGGLFVIAITVVKVMNLVERNLFIVIVLAVLAVMLAVYYFIWKSCKNAK